MLTHKQKTRIIYYMANNYEVHPINFSHCVSLTTDFILRGFHLGCDALFKSHRNEVGRQVFYYSG